RIKKRLTRIPHTERSATEDVEEGFGGWPMMAADEQWPSCQACKTCLSFLGQFKDPECDDWYKIYTCTNSSHPWNEPAEKIFIFKPFGLQFKAPPWEARLEVSSVNKIVKWTLQEDYPSPAEFSNDDLDYIEKWMSEQD